MPQLDFTFYISNAFWFLVSFSIFYISVAKFASRNIEKTLAFREEVLSNLVKNIKACEEKSSENVNLISKIHSDRNDNINNLQAAASKTLLEKRADIDTRLSKYYKAKYFDMKSSVSEISEILNLSIPDIRGIIASKHASVSKISMSDARDS